MELDYFKLQLQSHLNDHGFEKDDLANDIVIDNAENANNTFEQMRRAGHTVDEAIEFALPDLYAGIGMSAREVLANILLTNFSKRINVKDQVFLEFWINRIRNEFVIMNEFRLENGLGLDPRVLEESRGDFIHRIDQYLKTNGL